MSLKDKTARGVSWSTASQFVRQSFTLLVTAILARLLKPSDFGAIAMIVVFTNLATVFKDFGLSYAIIQHQDISDEQLDSSWCVNVVIGFALTVLIILASPLIASFYATPQLKPLTAVIALSFLITSFGSVQSSILSRDMAFKKLAFIEIAATIIAGLAATLAALRGAGVWALVMQQLGTATIMTACFMFAVEWRVKVRFSRQSMRGLVKFGANLTGFNFVNYFSRNADNMLVGKYIGSAGLGYYNLAYKLLMMPLQQISSVLGRVMFPALSKVQGDDVRFRRAYIKSTKTIGLISFPMMIGLLLLAPECIRFVFGPQWERSIYLVQIFAVIGLQQSIAQNVGWIYTARGRTDLLLYWGIFSSVVAVSAIVIGLQWGIEGVAISYAAASLLLSWPNFFIPFRLIDLPVLAYLKEFLRIAAATAIMAAVVYGLRVFLEGYLHAAGPVLLFSGVAVGVAVYCVLILVLEKELLVELKGMFRQAVSA